VDEFGGVAILDPRRCRMAEAVGDAQLYINGEYRDGTAGRRDVASPVTGELIGTVPVPGQHDVDATVNAAWTAGAQWARVNVWERAAICHAFSG
jgi:acyl-CoA reductase-like NAD-dependent aldehyde dehydrogenase